MVHTKWNLYPSKCLQRSFWHRQYIICDIVSLHCWLTKAYTSANTKCPFFTNPSLPLTMLPSERTIDKAPFSSFFLSPHLLYLDLAFISTWFPSLGSMGDIDDLRGCYVMRCHNKCAQQSAWLPASTLLLGMLLLY